MALGNWDFYQNSLSDLVYFAWRSTCIYDFVWVKNKWSNEAQVLMKFNYWLFLNKTTFKAIKQKYGDCLSVLGHQMWNYKYAVMTMKHNF